MVFSLRVAMLNLHRKYQTHFPEQSSGVVSDEGFGYFAGVCIIFFLLFSGFLLAKNKVPDWWIWVFYISPLQWAITAIVCNEFLSDRYSQVSETLNRNRSSAFSHMQV